MIGVLLVNLGTPDSPKPKDVFRYLNEFLTDERVIDIPWLSRQLLVRGVIVPFRHRQSARMYQEIWTEEGSPLKVYGNLVKEKLQNQLGDDFQVELAMRYQNPSIEKGLNLLEGADEIIVIPLFPQYASATTGSVHQKVMEVVKKWQVIPKLNLIRDFPLQETMIEAFCERMKEADYSSFDKILFSFHGLPERQLRKADRNNYCLQSEECCKTLNDQNKGCYSAQCHATAKAIAERLKIDEYQVSFQSRLGKDPWIQPYTSDCLQGNRLLVCCPAFVCDCLETTFEIGVEYAEEFEGEKLQLVEGLNDHPKWIQALKELVLEPRLST